MVLDNVNFLSRVLSYVSVDIKNIHKLMQVNNTWRETIEYYSSKLWLNINKHNPNTIFYVCEKNIVWILKLFLEAGVDSNIRNYNGSTPLHYAVLNGHI